MAGGKNLGKNGKVGLTPLPYTPPIADTCLEPDKSVAAPGTILLQAPAAAPTAASASAVAGSVASELAIKPQIKQPRWEAPTSRFAANGAAIMGTSAGQTHTKNLGGRREGFSEEKFVNKPGHNRATAITDLSGKDIFDLLHLSMFLGSQPDKSVLNCSLKTIGAASQTPTPATNVAAGKYTDRSTSPDSVPDNTPREAEVNTTPPPPSLISARTAWDNIGTPKPSAGATSEYIKPGQTRRDRPLLAGKAIVAGDANANAAAVPNAGDIKLPSLKPTASTFRSSGGAFARRLNRNPAEQTATAQPPAQNQVPSLLTLPSVEPARPSSRIGKRGDNHLVSLRNADILAGPKADQPLTRF